VLDKRN